MTPLASDGPEGDGVQQYVVEGGRRATEDAIFDALGPGVAKWMLLTPTPDGECVLQVPNPMAEPLEAALDRHGLTWERMEEVPPLGQIQWLNTLVHSTGDPATRERACRILVNLRNRRTAILRGEEVE